MSAEGIIAGEETVAPSHPLMDPSEKRFNGRTTQVTFHEGWKETVAQRVSNESMASSGKMLHQLKSLHEIARMEKKGGGGGGGPSGGGFIA